MQNTDNYSPTNQITANTQPKQGATDRKAKLSNKTTNHKRVEYSRTKTA